MKKALRVSLVQMMVLGLVSGGTLLAAPVKGLVTVVEGTVELRTAKSGADGAFQAVKVGQFVEEGDTLRTGAESLVIVKFQSKSVIRLGADTTLTVRESSTSSKKTLFRTVTASKTKLQLQRGKFFAQVNKFRRKSDSFVVQTPTAVAGVRGTRFELEVEEASGETDLFVLAGKVLLWSLQDYIDQNFEAGVLIREGRIGAVNRRGAIAAPRRMRPDRQKKPGKAGLGAGGGEGGDKGEGDDNEGGEGSEAVKADEAIQDQQQRDGADLIEDIKENDPSRPDRPDRLPGPPRPPKPRRR